ncbi:MAG TPA: hypothetical protein VHG32_12720 [Thermoanaerobaculia bacterium]|jgi:hypothetical protein|nr:hypothetical protein [Thermoanaerobaculia bacterium]
MASIRIYISVSADDRDRIVAAAMALGMSAAGWVRRQALSVTAGGLSLPAPLPGPPSRPSAKRRCMHTWLAEEQFAALVEHARACDLTVSAFIRAVLFDGNLNARRPFLRSAIVAIHRAGSDLSHLVQLAGGGTLLSPDTLRAVSALRQEVHTLRDALLTADAAAASKPPA